MAEKPRSSIRNGLSRNGPHDRSSLGARPLVRAGRLGWLLRPVFQRLSRPAAHRRPGSSMRLFPQYGHDADSAWRCLVDFRGEHFLRLAGAPARRAHWPYRRHRDSVRRERSDDFYLRRADYAAGVRAYARPEPCVAGGALRVILERRHPNRRCVLYGLAPPHDASRRSAEPACRNGDGFPVPGFRFAWVSNAGARIASVDRRPGNLLFADPTSFSNSRRTGLPGGGSRADGAIEMDPPLSF